MHTGRGLFASFLSACPVARLTKQDQQYHQQHHMLKPALHNGMHAVALTVSVCSRANAVNESGLLGCSCISGEERPRTGCSIRPHGLPGSHHRQQSRSSANIQHVDLLTASSMLELNGLQRHSHLSCVTSAIACTRDSLYHPPAFTCSMSMLVFKTACVWLILLDTSHPGSC